MDTMDNIYTGTLQRQGFLGVFGYNVALFVADL